ncbi:hypothetical protein Hanom_Chr06g00574851 [Helianthus anomalus]
MYRNKIKKGKMPFSSLRFGYFCDFRFKVCFAASGSKRFKILSFSSNLLIRPYFTLSRGILIFLDIFL